MAAMAQVRAQMRTIGVKHRRFAVLVSEYDLVAAEVVHGPHFADRQFVAIADEEPAVGNWVREALDLRHSFPLWSYLQPVRRVLLLRFLGLSVGWDKGERAEGLFALNA
jgi:hypothetical protein